MDNDAENVRNETVSGIDFDNRQLASDRNEGSHKLRASTAIFVAKW